MLFSFNPATPEHKAFTKLNDELLYFLQASINASRFSRGLFSDVVGQVCWDNAPTKAKFWALWKSLRPLPSDEREQLYMLILNGQSVGLYFADKSAGIPDIEQAQVKDALGELSKHLFAATKDLADIRDACGNQTIQAQFNEFQQLNGNVCLVCGSELLAQRRHLVNSDKQWRAPYDHLLNKADYPVFAIHPRNLFPICFTCNSKAKGKKELLFGRDGVRRLSFYPFNESCCLLLAQQNPELELDVKLHYADGNLTLVVDWTTQNVDINEKMTAWDEVYQIRSRVEGEQGDFVTWIDDECHSNDINEFAAKLAEKANRPTMRAIKSICWLFWHY
jgi:hypothetical protein